MSEEILKEIMIEGVDARELYGAQNAYLEQMRELMPKLKIVARGDTIKALGAKEDVAAFERRMNALVEYYLKYGHISSEVVSQAFSSSLAELSSEAVQYEYGFLYLFRNAFMRSLRACLDYGLSLFVCKSEV